MDCLYIGDSIPYCGNTDTCQHAKCIVLWMVNTNIILANPLARIMFLNMKAPWMCVPTQIPSNKQKNITWTTLDPQLRVYVGMQINRISCRRAKQVPTDPNLLTCIKVDINLRLDNFGIKHDWLADCPNCLHSLNNTRFGSALMMSMINGSKTSRDVTW